MAEARFSRMNRRPDKVETFMMLQPCLLDDAPYKGNLNATAILTYTILFHRQLLSIENRGRYTDKEGNVFCIYTQDRLAERLNIHVRGLRTALNKLEEFQLIRVVKMGKNQPNRIYVGLPSPDEQKGPVKKALHDRQEKHPSYIENNNIEKNNNPAAGKNLQFLSDSEELFVKAYGDVYHYYTGRRHPRINEEQMKRVVDRVQQVIADRDVPITDYRSILDGFFLDYVVTGKNDGNINVFIKRFESVVGLY